MITKRIDSGFYQIRHNGRVFEAETMERHSEGACRDQLWLLFEITAGSHQSDWMNNFVTLRDCKAAIEEICKES